MSRIPTVMDCTACVHWNANSGLRIGVCSNCFGGWPDGKPSNYEGQVTTFSTTTDSNPTVIQTNPPCENASANPDRMPETLNCQRFNDGKSAMEAWNRETNRNIDFADWMYMKHKKEIDMLIIKAEPVAGLTIEEAMREALELSSKTGCMISMEVNDIPMRIYDNSTVFGRTREDRVEFYAKEFRRLLSEKNRNETYAK